MREPDLDVYDELRPPRGGRREGAGAGGAARALKELRLPSFAAHCERLAEQARKQAWDPLRYLAELAEVEIPSGPTGAWRDWPRKPGCLGARRWKHWTCCVSQRREGTPAR